MDSARSTNSIRSDSPSNILAAWPRSAQVVTVFLLGALSALVVRDALSYTRWGSRPTELHSGPHSAYRVDINRADGAELMQLPGVGPRLAGRIESHRATQGLFRSVDQLSEVDGFGVVKLETLRPLIKTEHTTDALHISRKIAGKLEDGMPPVNLNTAAASELQKLPGIGPKLAQRIVDERQMKPFQSIDDLTRVSGIGTKKIEALRRYATVQDAVHQTARVP